MNSLEQQNGSDGKPSASSLLIATQKGVRAAKLSVLTSAVLASVKILAGVVGNSYALIADGVESVLDVFSTLVVWGSLRFAAKPPDENHPYGHGRAESLSALVVSLFLILAAVGIALQSLQAISSPQHVPAPFTLIVLVIVVATKEGMFRYLHKTGKRINSKSLQVDAWHHRTDALTSTAAFLGISIALLGGEGFERADGYAALFVSLIVLFNGLRLCRTSIDEIMDIAIPGEIKSRIRDAAGMVEGVCLIEKCRVRKSGLSLFVDIHVMVDGDITVREGHKIAHQVKDELINSQWGIADVTVHIEPEYE